MKSKQQNPLHKLQKIPVNLKKWFTLIPEKVRNHPFKKKKDRVVVFVLILTLPAATIWVLSSTAYLWDYLSTYWFSKLPPQIYLLVLLLMPFVAFNLSLWFFYKTKKTILKKLSIVNLILLVLIIGASFVLPS